MTDLLLVLLINFFALYTTSQYLSVLKKEEQKKTWRCLLPHSKGRSMEGKDEAKGIYDEPSASVLCKAV